MPREPNGQFLWNARESKQLLLIETSKKGGYATYGTGKWAGSGVDIRKKYILEILTLSSRRGEK